MPVNFFAGNARTLYLGTQSAKGTPQNTPTKALKVEDFTPIDPRTKSQLAETDRSTQESSDAVVAFVPGCSFKLYARPAECAFLYASLLGATANSGAPSNYTHVHTPALVTPYLTMFEVEPSLVTNKYVDCRVTKIEATGVAGGFIELTVTIEALSYLAGQSAPGAPALNTELPYVYPEIKVTKGGVYDGSRDAWSLTIDRQGKRALGDAGFASLDYVNGKFAVTGSLTQFMQADADSRSFDTGTTTGTTATTAIYSEALQIELIRDANVAVTIAMPQVSYPSRSAPSNPDGSPLVEVLGFRTLPQATLAANVVVTVKDHLATPDS